MISRQIYADYFLYNRIFQTGFNKSLKVLIFSFIRTTIETFLTQADFWKNLILSLMSLILKFLNLLVLSKGVTVLLHTFFKNFLQENIIGKVNFTKYLPIVTWCKVQPITSPIKTKNLISPFIVINKNKYVKKPEKEK